MTASTAKLVCGPWPGAGNHLLRLAGRLPRPAAGRGDGSGGADTGGSNRRRTTYRSVVARPFLWAARHLRTPRGLWFNDGSLQEPVPAWPGKFQVVVNPAQARWLGDNFGSFRLGGETGPEVFWQVSGGVTYRVGAAGPGQGPGGLNPPDPVPALRAV